MGPQGARSDAECGERTTDERRTDVVVVRGLTGGSQSVRPLVSATIVLDPLPLMTGTVPVPAWRCEVREALRAVEMAVIA
jgi:hypothetical protein